MLVRCRVPTRADGLSLRLDEWGSRAGVLAPPGCRGFEASIAWRVRGPVEEPVAVPSVSRPDQVNQLVCPVGIEKPELIADPTDLSGTERMHGRQCPA